MEFKYKIKNVKNIEKKIINNKNEKLDNKNNNKNKYNNKNIKKYNETNYNNNKYLKENLIEINNNNISKNKNNKIYLNENINIDYKKNKNKLEKNDNKVLKYNKYENIIIYNDNDLYNIYFIIKNHLLDCLNEVFDKEVILNFNEKIIMNLINKYLLNSFYNIIFISKNLLENDDINNNLINDLNLLKLNNYSKNKQIDYFPINIEEINLIYPNLRKKLYYFLENFNYKKMLILYSKNYIKYIKYIDIIFNNYNYLLIKLEDDKNKIKKLDKIVESLYSYRINSIDIEISKKLDLIELVLSKEDLNKYKINLNNIYNNISKKKEQNINIEKEKEKNINIIKELNKNIEFKENNKYNKNLCIIGNKEDKLNNIINFKYEKEIMNYLKIKIYNYLNNKKSLLFIIDEFNDDINNNYNKIYLNKINNKIKNSKIPIVILTNNINKLKCIEYNNYKIDYFNIEIEEKNNINNIIYSVSVIILLNLYIYKCNNIINFEYYINNLCYSLNKNKIKEYLKSNNICLKLVKLTEKIVYYKKFILEDIIYYIFKNINSINIKKNNDIYYVFDKFKNLVEEDLKIYNFEYNNLFNKYYKYDFKSDEFEKNSFFDYIENLKKKDRKSIFSKKIKLEKNFYMKYLKYHTILHSKEINNLNNFIKKIYEAEEKVLLEKFRFKNSIDNNKIKLIKTIFDNINEEFLKKFIFNLYDNNKIKKIDNLIFLIDKYNYEEYYDFFHENNKIKNHYKK